MPTDNDLGYYSRSAPVAKNRDTKARYLPMAAKRKRKQQKSSRRINRR